MTTETLPTDSSGEKTYFYQACNLSISSSIPLPELTAYELPVGQGVDIKIKIGKVDKPILKTELETGGCWRSSNKELFLYWKDSGAYCVCDGREIVVAPEVGAFDEAIRQTILGSALPAILHQRGFLILHASGVEVDGGALVFVANSGWGKSTTAGGLQSLGYRVLADDVVAIQVGETPNGHRVFPGYSHLKLWPDSATVLGHEVKTLALIFPDYPKRMHRMSESFSQAPLPLRCIYILDEGEHQMIEPMSPQMALMELLQNSFCGDFPRHQTLLSHFQQCAKIVNDVTVRKLQRTEDIELLPQFIRMIEADTTQS